MYIQSKLNTWKAISVILFFLIFSNLLYSQQDTCRRHELTIYAMPTLYPLNWESPSKLYSSMISCYIKTIGIKNNYLLGHVAVQINSPLTNGSRYIAQTSSGLKEKQELIFKQKIGLGIMGAALRGRMEPEKELKPKLEVYAKRAKLAMIRYRISEKAMKRILDFIEQYTRKTDERHANCDFYGGAFYPRYYDEGSGCSAFGIALLDLVHLKPANDNDWAIDVNIPMHLIGGKYNNNQKIKKKTILNTKNWYNSDGNANSDYVRYFIYDPTKMFDWIMKKRDENDSIFRPFDEMNVPGLYMDARCVTLDDEEPLFIKRKEPNLFIDIFNNSRQPLIQKQDTATVKKSHEEYGLEK